MSGPFQISQAPGALRLAGSNRDETSPWGLLDESHLTGQQNSLDTNIIARQPAPEAKFQVRRPWLHAVAMLCTIGIPTSLPAINVDQDGDGMSDVWEWNFGAEALNPTDDTDGDGFDNDEESIGLTNPFINSSVNKPDFISGYGPKVITDGQGNPVEQEFRWYDKKYVRYFVRGYNGFWNTLYSLTGNGGGLHTITLPYNGAFSSHRLYFFEAYDTDDDELNDSEESLFNSSITSTDTDSDGFNDRQEFINGTDPNGADPPLQAHSPNPANGATNVAANVTLSWSNGGAASTYKVYLGTDSTPDSGEYKGQQTGTSYVAGTLASGTTYYWRIDSVNAGGTTTGSVWSFTTKLPPPSPPVSPTPADGAADRSISANLSWKNGGGATSYEVYFGTDATPDSGEFRQTQSATGYDPGVLSNDTTYHWRIDSVSAGGTTTGSVWSFTTKLPLPGPAVSPTPSEGAPAVSIATNLSWKNGGGASSYDVYFGTSSAPGAGEFQGNQTGLSFSPGTLDYSTICYWRIDSVNAAGTTAGPVWDFTTEVPPPSVNAAGTTAGPVWAFTTEGSPPPVTISFSDFESGWGDWTNITGSDQFDWSRDLGGTPSSGTGPAIDHTLGNSSGYYAYVETSYGSAYYAGNTVILESIPFDADGHQLLLKFYYHMYGANSGTLTVDVFDGAWNLGVWSRSGQQHTGTTTPYTEGTVDLSNYTGMLRLRFRVVAAGSYRGDIAVDDISVIEYFDAPNTPPPVTISFSDFESGWGDWTNITGSDQFDWSRDWGGTPSSGTGPAIDHTLGNSSGYYAYVETSYGSAYYAGNTVILESIPFDADGHQLLLKFYYHMYGANSGTLTVDVFDGAWNLGVWSRSGQQHTGTTTPYTEGTVDLSNYTGMLRLRFRVVAAGSYRGDIAVDDISVIEYFDAPNTPPPMTDSFTDFESGWGDWTNITGSDQFDWSRDWGGTPSFGTGPAIDHTLGNSSGYYAYVETSSGSAYGAGNTVILESIPFDADGHQLRLRFYYHMYGANSGTLTVDVFDGAWNLGVWSRSGQQHTGTTTPYTEETVDLSNYTGMLTLRFRVVAEGSYRGDIAVDDISVVEYFDAPNTQPTIVSGPWADESPTQSQVIGLHVTATDAVGGSLNDQGEAGLTYNWQAVTTPVGAPAPTFSANGSNVAKDTSATVSASGVYTFEVTVSDGAAEVASTLQVEVQFVASLPSFSDFEAGWDDWHNVTGDSNVNWLRDAAGTPSYGTGPATDNTLGTTQGYYAYVETSSGDGYQTGRTVILESELFEVQAENFVLRFHYHMYGAKIGALYVDFYDGVWTEGIWSRAGQQQGSNAASYGMGEASIADVQGLVRFRFRYVTGGGYRGDVALDDLEVFAFDGPPNVTPWIVTAAAASENPTTDPDIELQVLGGDATDASTYNNGEAGLAYTWTTVSRPPGAPLPAFPPENGTALGKQVSITLPLVGEYIFRADVSDGQSSVTSDVTVYYSDPLALPSQTDFQLNWGAWSNSASNGSDWRRDSAGTPSSSTGPQLDHTMGNSSGFYAYVETSSGYAYRAGDTVSVVSPVIDASGGDLWLSFFYHMYGSNIGELNVDVFDGTWQEGVWSISGQQHSSYTAPYAHAGVALSGYSGNIVIRIRGVAAGRYRGDIAVDDIYLGPLSSDLDGDALPDWWEIVHFGQADAAVSSGDPDTDSLENLAEYFLNTDPNAATGSTAAVTVTVLTPLE